MGQLFYVADSPLLRSRRVKKKVVVELPKRASEDPSSKGQLFEAEALASIAQVVVGDSSSTEAFLREAKDADAVIVTWGIQITKEIIGQLDRCAAIGVASVGVDMVDVGAATAAGIVVTNVPDIFIEEVADHTMMLLLASQRRVKRMENFIHRGDWNKAWPDLAQHPRLWGQTLGLISFGNVARAVARRAQVFGLRVIAFDPYVTELKMTGENVEPVSLNELLERSDFISMHPPHNEETEAMLSSEHFQKMKRSAILINAGRGPTVDEPALIKALQAGEIAGAGLDVLAQEPPAPDNPLLAMENVLLSPHVASATTRMRPESRRRVGREVALVLRGKWPLSCVNPTVLPRVALERWQPYPMDRGPNR